MVSADTIQTLLMRIDTLGKGRPKDYVVEISLTILERSGLTYEEGYAGLKVLSTREGYKCIKMKHLPEMGISEDGFETRDVMAHVQLLPNFNETAMAFYKYLKYRRKPDSITKVYPNEDWSSLEDRFSTNEPDIDWSLKEYPDENDWLNKIRLGVESYNKATGSLELIPGKAVSIPRRGKVKKSTGEKYLECKVMEKLFSSKTTLSNGVDFHSLLGIHKDITLKPSDVKKVTNVRTAINKKLSDETGLKKLIKLNRNKAYINHLYLLKN
jgi:hypothetical protein